MMKLAGLRPTSYPASPSPGATSCAREDGQEAFPHRQTTAPAGLTPSTPLAPCPVQHYAREMDGLEAFLTYADNNAVGYFSKQQFTKTITLEKEKVGGW